jgi:putative transposase
MAREVHFNRYWVSFFSQPQSSLVDRRDMPLPRDVVPEEFYLITRRCTQRQFLLRPDDETNNAFIYCLGLAAERCDVDVLLPCAMSNHHHTVIYDRFGRYPEFIEYFHKQFARCQNALRGRNENLWAAEQPSVVRLVDAEDVLRKLVYTAMNPVSDHLVAYTHQWPGVNGLSALLAKSELVAHRPRHFFRSSMPETVTLRLRIPPALGNEDEVLADLKQRIASEEARMTLERTRIGGRVLGKRLVIRQSWTSRPETHEQRRVLDPRIAAINPASREVAVIRSREFVAAYRIARASWISGAPAAFPIGTYWLRRFAHVPIVPN